MKPDPASHTPAPAARITFRSIIIGLTLLPANAMWVALSEYGWYSGFPTCLSLFFNAILIMAGIALANLLLLRCRPGWALAPIELVVVYTMISVASAIAGHDSLQILLPSMLHLRYYGDLYGWYDEVSPHVPRWLLMNDSTALQNAYMGQDSIFSWSNLAPWVRPLAWWYAFVVALCAVYGGFVLVFRRQWIEHEKLAYPITQVPLAIAANPLHLLRSRLFWIGFAIAGFIDLMNGLHVLHPLIPGVPVASVLNIRDFFTERPWSDVGDVVVSFYPFTIGMYFFLPLDLAFSSWFFFFLFKAERILASQFGLQGVPGAPFIPEQMAGGFYAIALTALWMSRREILRHGALLVGRPGQASCPWDYRESRLAAVLLAGGTAFLLYFCHRAGMTWWVSVLLFSSHFLLSIAVMRARVELGPPVHDLWNFGANLQVIRFLGQGDMRKRNPTDLAMMAMFNFFNRVGRGHAAPHGIEALRMTRVLHGPVGPMLLAMAAAVVAGTFAAFLALLWMYYRYGAAAEIVIADGFGWEVWSMANAWFTSPETYRPHGAIMVLAGLLFCIGLAALRMNLAWWPFHPVGFALAGTWSMDRMWVCVIVAWAAKLAILRYGGARSYKLAVPFFIGLILGDFAVGGFWNLYGIFAERAVYRFFF